MSMRIMNTVTMITGMTASTGMATIVTDMMTSTGMATISMDIMVTDMRENIDNTRLIMTAQTETDGKRVIEGVERPDKKFCVGVQFHPEVAVRKNLENEKDADSFMDYDTALSLFKAFIDASHGDH